MQLELMNWRGKVEVLCHQLVLGNAFLMEV